MTIAEKIAAVRQQMKEAQVAACIIPPTDPHMGEYLPEHWAERVWISGFTGSAGTVVITMDFAGLWTDSRYFLQAEEQLAGSGMSLMKLKIPHTPEHIDWLSSQLSKGDRVGVNGERIPVSAAEMMQNALAKNGIEVVFDIDLVAPVWIDRPPLPSNMIIDHPVKFSGRSREEKVADIRTLLENDHATHTLICTLDEIAWTLNLRGSDVSFNPLFVSYLIISSSEAILYMDPMKIPDQLSGEIQSSGIKIQPYTRIFDDLASLESGAIVKIDPARTNQALYAAIPEGVSIIAGQGYATGLKAIKNETEIEGLKKVMIKDGVAWVRFLHWLETNIGETPISELSAAEKLDSFRREQEHYMGPSFHPISSYDHHGAVVHYAVSPESSIDLRPEGIYLCDTGGQYMDGTTDTTRTLALGTAQAREKSDFTLALKGTLAVSMLRFPEGTKGYQMDILARKALWDHGMNYGHGTGHGVGFFLNVHEGPQTIGTGATGNMHTAFEPGMVTTVEPAIYRQGSYGMRTENMTLCVKDVSNEFGNFLRFETLTLVPLDKHLFDFGLLTKEEIEWINLYHHEVREKLSPWLNQEEKSWLFEKTREIEYGADN